MSSLAGKLAMKVAQSSSSNTSNLLNEPLITESYFCNDKKMKLEDIDEEKAEDNGVDGDGENNMEGEGNIEDTSSKSDRKGTIVATSVGVIGIGLAAAAMVITGTILVYVAGAVCVLVGAVVPIRQVKVDELPTIRDETNKLRHLANDLSREVSFLEKEVDRLDAEKLRASHIEKKLTDLAQQQGESVEEMSEYVKKNSDQLTTMGTIVRRLSCEEIIQLLLSSDKDRNFTIDEEELERLMLRIHLQLEAKGVGFNKELFEKTVRSQPDVPGLIRIMRENMIDNEDICNKKEEEKLFSVKGCDFKVM